MPRTSTLLTLATLLGVPAPSGAETPAEVLAKVDAAAARGADVTLDLELVVTGDDGVSSRRSLRVWQKGDRRLVKVLAPPRLRGVGVLAGDGTLLLYLPASGKVRRISGRTRGDTFAGSGMSFDDLTRVALARDYLAEALVPDAGADRPDPATHHGLLLTPKEPARFRHHQVRLFASRDTHLVTRAEFLDSDGALLRRIDLLDVREVDGHRLAHRYDVEDRRRRRRTTATVSNVRFDQRLTDGFFGRRQLERAP